MRETGRPKVSRRRLLAGAATGLVGGLAGCGYRPGGGDLAWEESLGSGGLLRTGTPRFTTTDDRLFAVRNQSGRTFDFESETWQEVENATVTAVDRDGTTLLDVETERQAVAPPAVTEGSVFVPVERGRVTAIDRDAAEIDPNEARTTTDGGESDATVGDEIRWRVDEITADDGESGESADDSESGESADDSESGESADDSESGESADDGESGESEGPPEIDGVRASDRLVAVIGATDFVVLDAETGERAFEVTEAWAELDDVGLGADADRVAVDGEDVWVVVEGTESDAGSEDVPSVVVRFGPSGERRAERPISDGVDWLVVVDGTVVLGNAGRGSSVTGYDRDLDRQFTLEVPTPADPPPVVEGDGGDTASRVYLTRSGTVRAVDVTAGEIAWERSGVPVNRGFAVDADGIYAVSSRARGQSIIAVGADGADRWTAPLPADVTVDDLFAVADRLVVVDDDELYGLHATPGERWSLLGAVRRW
ncbi:hypothetical protein C461_05447 [Halorubrum aidingense JCM 13560]|uniref:Pyrrolo-quinoline quinone n=1 Tax=Halorubrum aidingense JCM 13560 TaxID=1230454 RepID=M0PJZ7_9EURY|nr:PQQ-binding-like beta-propeller repeat protein [Halorubrum aidingense]EMA69050.1 hypothetical protein C461_05447 [Halorubrum aidingense JCM 13560]